MASASLTFLFRADLIAGGFRVIDQVVHPLPFLRAEIKHWSVRSFDMLHF